MKRERISITESSCNFNIARTLTDLFDDDDVHKKRVALLFDFFATFPSFSLWRLTSNIKFHRRKFNPKDPIDKFNRSILDNFEVPISFLYL